MEENNVRNEEENAGRMKERESTSIERETVRRINRIKMRIYENKGVGNEINKKEKNEGRRILKKRK